MPNFWSGNVTELQSIRHELRDLMINSQKSKSENITTEFEKALRMMWKRFCLGLPSEHFDV
jgi:hypothetical protein